MRSLRLISFCVFSALLQAQGPPIRVGLDTQATEWIVSMDGGGEIQDRRGKTLMRVSGSERVRIWWDARGEADPTDEFRIQVGRPLIQRDADALMQKLQAQGERPDRVRVNDGDTWRVLTGRFDKAEDAEPILRKLQGLGFEELWVSTEKRPGKAQKGRALYAITDRYERRALPNDGIALRPKGESTQLVGKGRYRGRMDIFPNGQGRLTVVNTLDLETYLRGVVPREMGANEYPALEALKAQAVAARTYAVANRNKRSGEGFDLVDTVSDQVYGGKDGEQAMTDQAVRETEGLFATYGGQPIQALFMATGGGATVDVGYVFGGSAPYLRGVSTYGSKPLTLPFKSGVSVTSEADQSWLNWELLKLASIGALPADWLKSERMLKPATSDEVGAIARVVQQRLGMELRALPRQGNLLLSLGRSFGFHTVLEGQERAQDANYFVPGEWSAEDKLLAGFLTRRGFVAPQVWTSKNPPTLGQSLQSLGRMWQDLETVNIGEGTLLRDGQVRRKKGSPEAFTLAPQMLLAEEGPNGALRLLQQADIQVGDRLKWIPVEGLARVVVRRLDPDGAAWDRYNPVAHWRQDYSESELLALIRKRVSIPGIRDLQLTHNEHGRVLELAVVDTTSHVHRFSGMRIRGLLNLKDNVFRYLTVTQNGQRRWIFYGRGWGHGVGMDQTAAYGMALEGYTFEQILKYFYTGIELKKVNVN
jgi:stage II sporulation protein D